MRTVPLLFLTLALSAAHDEAGPAPTGGNGWTRPADREPADDWSERTGIPSPFPCRADMVWCEAHKTDRPNPDGSTTGAWVPSAGWFAAGEGPQAPDETPYVDALVGAYGDRGQAEALAGALASNGVESRIVEENDGAPAFGVFARVQVPDRRCGEAPPALVPTNTVEGAIGVYILEGTAHEVAQVLRGQFIDSRVVPVDGGFAVLVKVQAHVAVATLDTRPLSEAAEGVAASAGEVAAAAGELADAAEAALGALPDDAD